MKVLYPAKLGVDTKCPKCGTTLIVVSEAMYVCQNSHLVECYIQVTLKNQDLRQSKQVDNLTMHERDERDERDERVHKEIANALPRVHNKGTTLIGDSEEIDKVAEMMKGVTGKKI